MTRVPHQVDTFFFLSGFLFMWPQLKSYSLNAATKLTPTSFTLKLYMMRWLRLTPMYFFVLMVRRVYIPKLKCPLFGDDKPSRIQQIYIYVFPAVGNGPDWHTGDLIQAADPTKGTPERDFCKEVRRNLCDARAVR